MHTSSMIRARQFLRRQPLVRLFVLHTLSGFAVATIFVAALLGFNVGGIGALVVSQHAAPAMVLLWFFVGLTFASVQMGAAIIALAESPPPAGGKRLRVPADAGVVGARASAGRRA